MGGDSAAPASPPALPPRMSRATYFVQQCADGGRRSGLVSNRETVWYEFDPVFENPVLIFGIDLTAEGESVPHAPEALKEWFVDAADHYRRLLIGAADRLADGGEAEEWPVVERLDRDGTEVGVNAHATYGFGAHDLALEMTSLAGQLEARLRALPR